MDKSKIGLIIATHGKLGESLVQTTEQILARKSNLNAFTFLDGEEPKTSFQRLENLIRKIDQGDGVIILVDLFGGTPGSIALSMLQEKLLEVATGVNLPMALAAATLDPGYELHEACSHLVTTGQNAIKEAGALLRT